MRREVWQRGVVVFAVIDHDLAHGAEAEMLVCAFCGIRHDDESDMVGCQGFRGLAGEKYQRGAFDLILAYSHPSPDIDVAARDFRGAEKRMATIAAGTGNLDGVAAAVGLGGVKRDGTALVAVRSVCRPRGLIPSTLKIVGDLSK